MSGSRDHVVLIHGLGRSRRSMLGLFWWLRCHGFAVLNVGYPSQRITVAEAVSDFLNPALAELKLEPGAKVHFVTHSLGGIIFRAWAAQRDAAFPLGRTVMLAPPNQGSEIADHLADRPWIHLLLGPVIREIGSGETSTPNQLGPVPPETAVIMGRRSLLTLFDHLLGRESDGIVTVAGGHVAGEAAFHVMEADHTYIMWRPAVLRLVVHFLKTGSMPIIPCG
jgi:pimeloyl-ACP methyl ester carboxylesterase